MQLFGLLQWFSQPPEICLCASAAKMCSQNLFLWEGTCALKNRGRGVCGGRSKVRSTPLLWDVFIKGWSGVGRRGNPRVYLFELAKILPFSLFPPHWETGAAQEGFIEGAFIHCRALQCIHCVSLKEPHILQLTLSFSIRKAFFFFLPSSALALFLEPVVFSGASQAIFKKTLQAAKPLLFSLGWCQHNAYSKRAWHLPEVML